MGSALRKLCGKSRTLSQYESSRPAPDPSLSATIGSPQVASPQSNNDVLQSTTLKPNRHFTSIFSNAVHTIHSVPGTKLFLAAGEDKIILKVDWNSGEIVSRTQTSHTNDIKCSRYLPNSKLLITGSRDSTIMVYSVVENGNSTPLKTLKGHTLVVSAMVVNEEETLLLSGSRDNTIRLWDIEGGSLITLNKTARNLVHSMQWIPGSTVVVQASEDLYIRLWDTANRSIKLMKSISGLEYHPICMAVSANGKAVITGHNGFGGQGCMLKVWDATNLDLKKELFGHSYTVNNVVIIEDEKSDKLRVLSTSNDSEVKLWDVDEEQCVYSGQLECGRVTSMAVVKGLRDGDANSKDDIDVLIGCVDGVISGYKIVNHSNLMHVSEWGTPKQIGGSADDE